MRHVLQDFLGDMYCFGVFFRIIYKKFDEKFGDVEEKNYLCTLIYT